MTWKYINASVKGTSHIYSGAPCQDYSSIKVITLPFGAPTLIATAADGAGSAPHSKLGSRLACSTITQVIEQWLSEGPPVEAIDESLVKGWFQQTQQTLYQVAQRKGLQSPRELATTLMISVVAPQYAIFGQIGDGAIVYFKENDYELAFWPQTGEYQNSTYFVTDEKALQYLQYKHLDTSIEEFAILTDGLQMLALEYAHQRPFDRFFSPLFDSIRKLDPGPALSLKGSLQGFLASDRVNERTDDDKTLILASKKTKELVQ